MKRNILEVHGLSKTFEVGGGLFKKAKTVHALDRVSLSVAERGALGIVGESGCGKSTLARCLIRLAEPSAGSVTFEGQEIAHLKGKALRAMRRRAQMIFQDPYASLNPQKTIWQTLAEPLLVHGVCTRGEVDAAVEAALNEVGLPSDAASRSPHAFSGGQRQRIGIARALLLRPSLIVADEPVSALDVSVQAQVLKLLETLKERHNLSLVFVSHDLGVVRHVCDRVAVMYLGRIIEEGPVKAIFDRPLHPYTQMLRAASPVPDPAARFALPRIIGEIPSAMHPPSGCAFHPRCPHAMPRCAIEAPEAHALDDTRRVACFLHEAKPITSSTALRRVA
jgi:peptide/nickel transport system ATP-binding protein